MPLFQPSDPQDAARRTLAFLNRSCFVHHLANGEPLRNLRITPKDDLLIFHHQLERLVVSLSNALIIDNGDWHDEISKAIEKRLKMKIAIGPKNSPKIRTLRTIFAVLNSIRPNS